MRLGIITRSDNTGLGYQTKSYVKHLNPSKIINIDLSPLNGNKQNQWYEDAVNILGIPRDHELKSILSGIDVLLTAETPYNMNLYKVAREMGVKTVCVENAEFYDHIKYPDHEMPDLIIMPSVWKLEEIRRHAFSRGTKVIQIHHPVDREEIHFVERKTCNFIHIAGKPASYDRNGTFDYLQADPRGRVTTQSTDLAHRIGKRYPQCRIYQDIEDNNELYQKGDVLVLPRRYGGNCLVLNEALASGMPVIMPDISPNDHLLPKEWLVQATVTGHFSPRTNVDIYSVHPRDLLQKMEWFKEQDISELSRQADKIADTISWDILKPVYINALEELCS